MPRRFDFKTSWPEHNSVPQLGSGIWLVTLTVLALLLSGCQTQPIKPCVQPVIPTAPALKKPMPSQTYSGSVAADFEKWERRLTPMPTTP